MLFVINKKLIANLWILDILSDKRQFKDITLGSVKLLFSPYFHIFNTQYSIEKILGTLLNSEYKH